MKYKVILKDGTYGEINCSDYDNVPDFAWHKYGDDWSEIIRPGLPKTEKCHVHLRILKKCLVLIENKR